VHWHLDKEFYDKVKVNPKGNVEITSRSYETEAETKESGTIWIKKSADIEETESVNLTLADLTRSSIYFTYVQLIAIMFSVF
jgi:hypothetical protein